MALVLAPPIGVANSGDLKVAATRLRRRRYVFSLISGQGEDIFLVFLIKEMRIGSV